MNANDILNAMIFGGGGSSGGGSSSTNVEDMTTTDGVLDAGKVLAVGDDGKITPVTLGVGEGEIAVDATLLIQGAAADAKATGDALDLKADIFKVAITNSNDTYTADKTYAQILSAVSGQKTVVAYYSSVPHGYLGSGTNKLIFGNSYYDNGVQYSVIITINSDETIAYNEYSLNISGQLTSVNESLQTKAGTSVATTSANGLMSSTDKTRLDAVYADYSSAITALGVSE